MHTVSKLGQDVGGLQRRPGKGAVDIVDDGQGLVDDDAMMLEHGHLAEGVQLPVRRQGEVHRLQPPGNPLFRRDVPSRPAVGTEHVGVEDDIGHLIASREEILSLI